MDKEQMRIYTRFHLLHGKSPNADPQCEYCAGSGYIEHLPLHPDDTTIMTSPCECLGSDTDTDNTPEE